MEKTHIIRCGWASDDLLLSYHDTEWGVPVHDDRKHFEFMLLDSAQAGLNWRTVLLKRDGYKDAFADFDYNKVAKYSTQKVASLLEHPGIIKNRLKIASAVNNAKAFINVIEAFGSFDKYIWQFVDGKTIVNGHKHDHDIAAVSDQSIAMSKDLRKRGFTFVGPTICYAYMQAAGMVNDHITTCFRYSQV